MRQFDSRAIAYSRCVGNDSLLRDVAYPFVLKALGDVRRKTVLDVGCGEGTLARILAQQGARMVGYDISKEQIALAKMEEKKQPLGINYLVSDATNFKSPIKFDGAVSVTVLPYAQSLEQLTSFFSSTYRSLKPVGAFTSVVANPDFSQFGKLLFGRRYTLLKNKKVKVEFFDQRNTLLFSVIRSHFSRSDYGYSAHKAGFQKLIWKRLKVNKKAISAQTKNYRVESPYIGLIVKK